MLAYMPFYEKLPNFRWNNLVEIKKVKSPILFIGGDKDNVSPIEMT